MRTIIRNTALGLIVVLSIFISISTASAELTVTTVLLPEEAVNEPIGSEKMLKISADGSSPIQSTCAIRLRFNMKAIPSGARITKATIRLVGIPANDNPQLVRVFTNAQGQGKSIGKWTAKSGQTIFDATSEGLVREVVKTAKSENQSLSLWLLSKSRLSEWNYYSLKDFGEISAKKPRLILEYQIERSPTLPTDRTAWKFFLEKTTFKLKDFRSKELVISNPAIYKNNIFLFAKPTDTSTNLYAVHFNGRDNWYKSISVPPGANVLVNSAGVLYSIGENRIALYDLEKKGELIKTIDIDKDDFRLFNPPILGADSSLYFTHYGYLYGLNQEAKELWRYPHDDARAEKISRIILSPDAQKNAYALMRIKGKNKFLSINTATGSSAAYAFGNRYTFFHCPLAVERQGKDYIIFSAYSEADGTLSCYSNDEKIWTTLGPVSQPASDMAGKLIYVVQNGKLQAIDTLNGRTVYTSSRTDLAATSNLVLDGEDNVYFWNNGRFFVFTNKCELLVEKKLPDLPERLELLFSPDGTLYARNIKNKKLTLVLPNRQALTLNPDNFQNDTIYSADALRVAKNMRLVPTANIALKASDSISFGTGFSVKKGARLTCKTGF